MSDGRLIRGSRAEHHSTTPQAIFQQELEKHSKVIKIIEQNLLAQDNITHNITELNAEFVPVRRKINEAEEKWVGRWYRGLV